MNTPTVARNRFTQLSGSSSTLSNKLCVRLIDNVSSLCLELAGIDYAKVKRIDNDDLRALIDTFVGISVSTLIPMAENEHEIALYYSAFNSACENDVPLLSPVKGQLPWSAVIAITLMDHAIFSHGGRSTDEEPFLINRPLVAVLLDSPRINSVLYERLNRANFSAPDNIDHLIIGSYGLMLGQDLNQRIQLTLPGPLRSFKTIGVRTDAVNYFNSRCGEHAASVLGDGDTLNDINVDNMETYNVNADDPSTAGEFDAAFFESGRQSDADTGSTVNSGQGRDSLFDNQRSAVTAALSQNTVRGKLRKNEDVERFLNQFKVEGNFVEAVERNSQILVLGLRRLLDDEDSPKDKELLNSMLRKIEHFDTKDETITLAIALVGAFEGAFHRSTNEAVRQLSGIPDMISIEVRKEINSITDDARRKTQKLIEDMETVHNQVDRIGDEIGGLFSSINDLLVTLPDTLTEKMDKAIRSQTKDMFRKGATGLQAIDKRAGALENVVRNHVKTIDNAGNKATRSVFRSALLWVPIITILTCVCFLFVRDKFLGGLSVPSIFY